MGCLITWGYEFVFLLLLSAASRINSLPLGWWRSFCNGFCPGLLPSGNGTWQWKIHEKPEFMGNVPSQQKPPWLVRRLPQRWSWWPPGKLWKTWDSLKWCPEQLTFEVLQKPVVYHHSNHSLDWNFNFGPTHLWRNPHHLLPCWKFGVSSQSGKTATGYYGWDMLRPCETSRPADVVPRFGIAKLVHN